MKWAKSGKLRYKNINMIMTTIFITIVHTITNNQNTTTKMRGGGGGGGGGDDVIK